MKPEVIQSDDFAPIVEVSDSELLRRFVVERDRDALEAIARRHSALVWSLCRRMLAHDHDAEDAFQATFLIFARDARRIRKSTAVSAWLYGVAYRICQRVRRDRRRVMHELSDDEIASFDDDPLARLSLIHDQEITESELNRLPDSWRTPLILKYYCDCSNRQIADELSIAVTAVEGRLKRARNQLRLKLARHGISLGSALLVFEYFRSQAIAMPSAACLDTTLQYCSTFGGGTRAAVPTRLQPAALQLANQELTMIGLAKFPVLTTFGGMAATTFAIAISMAFAGPTPPAGVGESTVTFPVGEDQSPVARVAIADSGDGGTSSDATLAKTTQQDTNPFALDENNENKEEPFDDWTPEEGDYKQESPARISVKATSTDHPGRTLEFRDGKVMPVSESRIEQALASTTEFDFFQATLPEIIATLQDKHKISMIIDTRSIEVDGTFDISQRFDLQLKDVAFDEALEILLREMDLTYYVDRSVLTITTHTAAHMNPLPKFYKLPNGTTPEVIENIIKTAVDPDVWVEQGGSGSMLMLESGMLISTNYETHREITRLLQQYEELLKY
jgi:RNA polymerase sigma factor (sigma-70 family)